MNPDGVPWILSPNGGGRTIEGAKSDALLVANALERPNAQVRISRQDVPFMGIRKILMQVTERTVVHTGFISISIESEAPDALGMARILRRAAGGSVDADGCFRATRDDAVRALASSTLCDLLHDDVTISISRPTPLYGARAAVLQEKTRKPFQDFHVAASLPQGRLVLTSTPETDRDAQGRRTMCVTLDSDCATHRLEKIDPMDVLRAMEPRS